MKTHGPPYRAPLFSPSVGRFHQGMIVQVPLACRRPQRQPEARRHPRRACRPLWQWRRGGGGAAGGFGRAAPEFDPTKLNDTDRMELHAFGTEGKGHANLVAVLDNLGKGPPQVRPSRTWS